jgi:arabinofuranan 3-O-arabinosyltransferase
VSVIPADTRPTDPDAEGQVPDGPTSGGSAGGPTSGGRVHSVRTPRAFLVGVSGIVLLQVLLQRWGKITHDTRLDLLLSPAEFMGRIWTFWDPVTDMGHIRNQTVGYAFPMGPAFLGGRLAGLSPWVVGRLWIAVLLIAAFWGAVRLLDELAVGTVVARLISGAAYALGPFMVARIGNTSSFVLGAAFLPWVVLMVVKGTRRGSPRRYAAMAGLAVLAMGGINAAVTLSVLVMPVFWLLTREKGPRRRRFVLWAIVAFGMATFWWAAPLVLQGKYGVDFLHFTETSRVTTFFNPPFEAVRGLADWLSYFRVDQVMTVAGEVEATNPMVLVVTGLIAAAGLAGLARRDIPERAFLWLTLLAGLAVLSAGYGGAWGNPLAGLFRTILDGPLGAFRTVYKFAPIVALVLVVGLAHTITVLGEVLQRRSPRGRTVIAVLAGALVIAGAWPLLRGDLLNQRGFEEVPSWWSEAATYVKDTPGRALLVPGLAHGDFYWGYTAEEPLDWNRSGQWAARNLTFQASEGAVAYMDTIQAAINRGGDPNLPALLREGGFSQVVVRNDGSWTGDDAPPAQAINSALLNSGLESSKAFGPVIEDSRAPGVSSLELQAVEVYQVPGTADSQPAAAVVASDLPVVSGDPGVRLKLADAGLVDRPVILAQDLTSEAPEPTTWIVTDGNQRRFTFYGRINDAASYVLTPGESGPDGIAAEAGLPLNSTIGDQTVAVLDGVAGVTASSYGAWFKPVPEVAPNKALDGDPTTAWTSAAFADVTGQWIKVDLGEKRSFDTIGVELLDDGPWRPVVTAIDVTTEQGTVRTDTVRGEDLQQLAVPAGPTSWIRLTLAGIETGDAAVTGAGIREIQLPGVTVDQRLQVPSQLAADFSDPSTNLPAYVFQRTTANPRFVLRKDEEPTMRRRFLLPRSGSLAPGAQVTGVPSPALLSLVNTTPGFSIEASSTLGDLPGYSARHLVDVDPKSIWVAEGSPLADTAASGLDGTAARDDGATAVGAVPAARQDDAPFIRMRWNEPRAIANLHLERVAGYSSPASVRIEGADGQVRKAEVDADGKASFEPMVATDVTVTFPKVSRYAISNGFGEPTDRPLAMASFGFSEIDDLMPGPVISSQTVSFTCAQGPIASIDGIPHRFSLTATLGDIVDFRPVTAEPCGDDATLPAGSHDVDTSMGDAPFAIGTLSLVNDSTAKSLDSPPTSRGMSVTTWGDTEREVAVEPGPAAYLIVHESANLGWRATLDGQELPKVTIDGWQQGYLVPAGNGGTVDLVYTPTTTYRASLLLGGLLVVLLLGLALVPGRGPFPAALGARRLHPVVLWAVAGVAMFVVGGIAGLALLALVWVMRFRWPHAPPLVAGGAFAVASVVVAMTQTAFPDDLRGAFGVPATVLSLLAIAAVAGALVPLPARFRRTGEEPSGPSPQDDARPGPDVDHVTSG